MRTSFDFPDELPRRKRNLPDWSSLEDVRTWRFRPVPVVARQLGPALRANAGLPTAWAADSETINRVLTWMRLRGWGEPHHERTE
jgi:hypothetical protein